MNAMQLNLVALGDSVVWGQGHRPETKFVTLVHAWLVAQGHEVAPLVLKAHSEATVADSTAAPVPWAEIPCPAPGIGQQLDALTAEGVRPDVVILGGGINDVGALHVAIANPFDGRGAAGIGRLTSTVFDGSVRPLLSRVCAAFPAARVVVTGYFPLFSAESALRELIKVLDAYPDARLTTRLFADLDRLLGAIIPRPLARAFIGDQQRKMVAQCEAFLSTAHASLIQTVSTLQAAGHPVAFADPGFTAQDAFGTPNTLLWNGEDDPLRPERERLYLTQGLGQWNPGTPAASICHPNVRGAQRYADAVIQCLRGLGLSRQARG
jgi:lysophospholipase L1-like esterase